MSSKIEWTDETWEVTVGCNVVSPGCTNCYAMRLVGTRLKHLPQHEGLTRTTKAGPVWTGAVRPNPGVLDQPLRWRRPRMIFVDSRSDLFHPAVPDEWIDQVFAVMALASQHVFQVLTKRPERMRAYLAERHPGTVRWVDAARRMGLLTDATPSAFCRTPLPGVWLGTSCEDQAAADERVPYLLATPAAVRFVSCEPLLSAVDLDASRLDWVIAGGESGPHARPAHPDWFRSLRDQCQAAGTAFHFKQHGAWLHEAQHYPCPELDGKPVEAAQHFVVPEDEHGTHQWPDGSASFRVGKKRAGRLLDGREWNQMPGVS